MPARIDGPRISRARPLGRRVEVGRVAVLLSVGIGAFAVGFQRGSEVPSVPRPSAVVAPVAAVGGGAGGAGGAPASPGDGRVEASPVPAVTPIPVDALQARLAALRKKYSSPGVSVTIIWPDGRQWTGVSGWANMRARVPVATTTDFAIGSVSKTFIAALMLQLAEEGKLSLDDPLRRWLPTAHVPYRVTLRQMLDHTSGLYDFFSNPTIDAALMADKRRTWTPARSLSYMRAAYFAPGTDWHYSNSNYVLLGQVVEKVTGHSVASELRRRFFTPLGMSRTFVQGIEPRRATVATAYVQQGWGTSLRWINQSDGTAIAPFTSVTTAAGYAGAIASSSRDLAIWAHALYAGSVLTPQSLAEMEDVSHSVSVGAPRRYGLGFMEEWFGGRRTFGHNGRLVGSRTSIRYLPDSGFTIAIVTNQDRYLPDVIGTSLLNIAIPPPPPPPSYPTPSPTPTPFATPTPTETTTPEPTTSPGP